MMIELAGGIALIDGAAREVMLFAAFGFLCGGIDDLLVDLLYWTRLFHLRVRSMLVRGDASVEGALDQARIAIFIPAWDESAVIGAMLRTTLARLDYADYRIFVGTYPNDPATIAAVAEVARDDARVHLVVGARPGPTTKADCLNGLWRALLREELTDGVRVKGVVLHDAEDVVHGRELTLFNRALEDHGAVQLPVLPLVHPKSRFVSGHYCDEFAEANWPLPHFRCAA